MFEAIKKRLAALESKILDTFPLFPDDEDGFIAALGLDPSGYQVRNADGSIGYDFLKALSSTAADDWADGED